MTSLLDEVQKDEVQKYLKYELGIIVYGTAKVYDVELKEILEVLKKILNEVGHANDLFDSV